MDELLSLGFISLDSHQTKAVAGLIRLSGFSANRDLTYLPDVIIDYICGLSVNVGS